MKLFNIQHYFGNFLNCLQKGTTILRKSNNNNLSLIEQLSLKTNYKQLFENYPEGIAMLDNANQVVNVNGKFEQLFGYSLKEIKGLNLNDFIVPDLLYDEVSPLPYSFLTENAPQNEYIRKRKDGNLIYVSVLAFPIVINNKQTGYYSIYRDITDRKRIEEKLIHLGIYDSLTGLYNRTFFKEQMRNYDLRMAETGIIICDINGLKIINDSLGHQVGDTLLINVAHILTTSLRSTDIVARIGGDEFAILLPYARKEEVEIINQRIQKNLCKYNENALTPPLSLSLGWAVTQDTISTSMEELFKEADNNMYREKISNKHKTRKTIIASFMSSLETKDFITDGHIERLKNLIQNVGKVMNLPEAVMTKLYLLAQYHDIGKIGISDTVLFKKGFLNMREIKEIQWHSELGSRIAHSTSEFIPIEDLILKHHEKWDGSGYPLGLSGETIPLECRIFALVDAYDAMISKRPYRKTWSKTKAITEIKNCAGTHFDPYLVENFIKALNYPS